MKYIFFGNPEFSAIILQRLIKAGFAPELVVCNPDKPVGRKKIITPPQTKLLAIKYQIPTFQPKVLSNSKFEIRNSKYGLFVVAAYGKLIPKEILGIPRLGVINVHPSLLPKYRGPTPIQTAILNGDEETGVTLILLDKEMDYGPILANYKLQITNYKIKYEELLELLAELGAELLIETMPKFANGEIKPRPQDHSRATYTKRFSSDDAFVEYEDLRAAILGEDLRRAIQVDRMIRALNPEPGVWTRRDEPAQHLDISKFKDLKVLLPPGKRVKLLEAEIVGGQLRIKKIQVDGKTPRILD